MTPLAKCVFVFMGSILGIGFIMGELDNSHTSHDGSKYVLTEKIYSTNVPIESGRVSEKFIRDSITTDHLNFATALVKLYGYCCDSITSMRGSYAEAHFNLGCNYFRYTYDIDDKGGHWVATVE